MKIRLRIKETAEQRGFSQSKLARLADIDAKTMRRFFREPDQPATTFMLAKIATVLQVHVCDLLQEMPGSDIPDLPDDLPASDQA